MGHAITEQRFGSYEDVKRENGPLNGSQQKGKIFTGVVFINYQKDGRNV